MGTHPRDVPIEPRFVEQQARRRQLREMLAGAETDIRLTSVDAFIHSRACTHGTDQMVAAAGRPMSMSLVQREGAGDQWREVIRRAEAASGKQLDMRFQVPTRAIGVLMGLTASMHPFVAYPTFRTLSGLSLPELVRALRTPLIKAAIVSEQPGAFARLGNAAPAFVDDMLKAMETLSARIFPDRGVPTTKRTTRDESAHAGVVNHSSF